MHLLKLVVMIALSIMFSTAPVLANQKVADDKKGVGEKLLSQLWKNMEKMDIVMIEKAMAEGFQSVHDFGANDRAQEIKLIKGLKLGKYTLSNIKITQNGPVIVATYFVAVEETIDGERLSKVPAPRLSVFVNTENGWKWVAHANLKPVR